MVFVSRSFLAYNLNTRQILFLWLQISLFLYLAIASFSHKWGSSLRLNLDNLYRLRKTVLSFNYSGNTYTAFRLKNVWTAWRSSNVKNVLIAFDWSALMFGQSWTLLVRRVKFLHAFLLFLKCLWKVNNVVVFAQRKLFARAFIIFFRWSIRWLFSPFQINIK